MSKNLGDSLSDMAIKQLNARESSVIIATISENGFPNTTPVHLIIAKNPKTLLFGMSINHQGALNIRSNPKIMISLCEKDDLNISIKCEAKIIREKLDCNPGMCVVEAKIEAIKDDSTHSKTVSGIRYECKTEKGKKFIQDVFNELETI